MIGIVAPYGWNDETSMAITLANHAASFGVGVKYFATSNSQGVCPAWDNRVKRSGDFKQFLRGLDRVIWFNVQPDRLAAAKRAGKDNTLIVNWHQLSDGELAQVANYDRCVCPSMDVCKTLGEIWPATNLTWVPWDSGMQLTSRQGRVDTRRIRVYCPVQAATMESHGHMVVTMFEILVDRFPNLELTFGYQPMLPKHLWGSIEKLAAQKPKQFFTVRRPSWSYRALLYSQHDWTLWLPSKEWACQIPLESLSAGTPLISHDMPPLHSTLSKYNSVLVPCGLTHNELGVPTAEPNSAQLIDKISDTLRSRYILEDLHGRGLPELSGRRLTFQSYWRHLWQLEETEVRSKS